MLKEPFLPSVHVWAFRLLSALTAGVWLIGSDLDYYSFNSSWEWGDEAAKFPDDVRRCSPRKPVYDCISEADICHYGASDYQGSWRD